MVALGAPLNYLEGKSMAKTIMRAFRLHEISAVDRPAQAHAKAAIMKREFSASERKEDAKSGAAESDGSFPIENSTDLHNAMRAIGRSKNPEKTRAHIRSRAKALGLESELSDAFKRDDKESNFMNVDILKALGLAEDADEAAVAAAVQALAEKSEKALHELEIAKAGMTEEETKHHDALEGDEAKKAFRALSKEDRAKAVAKAVELPEEVRKALGEAAALRKRVADLEDEASLASFRKQAVDLGLPEADGAVIQKAYRGNKEAVDHLIGVIKAQSKQVAEGGLFKEFGTTRGDATSVKAYDELKAKAEQLQKAMPSLTIEQAFEKVYTDRANAKLIEREIAERA